MMTITKEKRGGTKNNAGRRCIDRVPLEKKGKANRYLSAMRTLRVRRRKQTLTIGFITEKNKLGASGIYKGGRGD